MMQKMRLNILYQPTEEPWGGSNTFFRNFCRTAVQDTSVEWMDRPGSADVILSAGHYRGPGKFLKTYELRNVQSGRSLGNPLGFLSHQKRRKILFRVDGLRKIYAEGSVPADEILLKHLPYADGYIFQSEFSRRCFENIPAIKQKPCTVIRNGANTDIFSPGKQTGISSKKIILISNGWSTNLRKGFGTIAAFSRMSDVTVKHIGRWPDSISSEKVECLGPKKEKEIGSILREGHFFLFPSENEACPNVVVEALACGLPVLYHPSGGTAELVRFDQMGLAIPSDAGDIAQLGHFMEQALNKHSMMMKNILGSIDEFSFNRCYQKYISFMRERQ
ncbi:MAG: glycosyltransferase [Candidatus Omnitrophica bacterium]|nr:glycosyltransferase [Candidatus Omnitrophota bacterium]